MCCRGERVGLVIGPIHLINHMLPAGVIDSSRQAVALAQMCQVSCHCTIICFGLRFRWFWTLASLVILCHHCPGWISLAFGQDPLHSNGDLPLYIYMALPYTSHGNHHFHHHHPSHSSFTYGQYLLPSKLSHLQATSSAHSH